MDATTSRAPARRLGRAERREQILDAATSAFARAGGFAHTGLDDVAAAAGVTRMIVYRHFESKNELYAAVIDRAAERLYAAAVVDGEMDDDSVARVIDWARSDPDGFRVLFRYAAVEPEFRDGIAELKTSMAAHVRPYVEDGATDRAWTDWAARTATALLIESIMAWLDGGQPDPEHATARILRAVDHAVEAIAAV
ncbi:DNA-binding transcriptional regulator, AcrR family [Jiangella sp. DSM 45060]|nr:DNA-binding transcriptional regulator, AcrR family [Jiangella sp. DSM 45060]